MITIQHGDGAPVQPLLPTHWECECCGLIWEQAVDPYVTVVCGQCGGTLVDVRAGHARRDERDIVLQWLTDELRDYADAKFNDDIHKQNQLVDDVDFWIGQITNYLTRVKVYTLADPRGLQAMLKIISTTVGWGEAAVRVHGLPPKGGTTSGEVVPWTDGA